ncbi:MAG: hypothetical protein HYT62_01030 [Candidatus Yanofskybacteria bacterium]|nr:hypothetical protein [Candidatus Yanofskybacteria bacterium]
MKKVMLAVVLAVLFVGWSSVSYAQCVPGGTVDFVSCFRSAVGIGASVPPVASDLVSLLENIGGFLIVAAGVVAGIVIIVSGIVYMSSGSDTGRLTTAKAIFKNGIVGALIIFAAGIIINTIALIALDPFGFFS